MRNFTVSALYIFLSMVDFWYLPKGLQELKDYMYNIEAFCDVVQASQVVMVQNSQQDGREFVSILFLFY